MLCAVKKTLNFDTLVWVVLAFHSAPFILEGFASVLQYETEPFFHVLCLTCHNIVYAHEILDVIHVLLELQGQLLAGVKDK